MLVYLIGFFIIGVGMEVVYCGKKGRHICRNSFVLV